MSRLITAIRFVYASYLLVKDDPLFFKYLAQYGLGGLILLLLWFIPLALVVGLIGLTSVGLILMGLVIFIALISLLLWGRIMMLQVIAVFDRHILIDEIAEQETLNQKSWIGPLNLDAALFAFSLPGLKFGKALRELFYRSKQDEDQWLEAGYLNWPIMALESLPLDQAVNRLKQIKKKKLIRFQPGFIPVSIVTWMLQWIIILLGAWIGFVVGMNTADPILTTGIVPLLGALIGLLLGGVFAIIGIHLNTFSQACYYTALYRWVKNVETAMITGMTEKAAPPAILGHALGKALNSKKER